MFLVRKITLTKWDNKEDTGLSDSDASSDGITYDLRTTDNVLSFWRCSSEDDIQDIALAIATTRNSLDNIHVVWLRHEDFEADGQILQDEDGATPVTDMAKKHVNVRQISHTRLCKMAERIDAAIKENRYKKIKRSVLRDLIKSAMDAGRVSPQDIQFEV